MSLNNQLNQNLHKPRTLCEAATQPLTNLVERQDLHLVRTHCEHLRPLAWNLIIARLSHPVPVWSSSATAHHILPCICANICITPASHTRAIDDCLSQEANSSTLAVPSDHSLAECSPQRSHIYSVKSCRTKIASFFETCILTSFSIPRHSIHPNMY